MGGIAGAWHRDGRVLERSVLEAQANAIAHRGRRTSLWHAGPAGLVSMEEGAHHPGQEPATGSGALTGESGSVLCFDGRLDDRDDLIYALGAFSGRAGADDPSDRKLLLAVYESLGPDFVEHIRGDFALAVWDPRNRRLLLARDSLGVRPLYYHVSSSCVVFGSEVKAVLAHPDVPARPDDAYLAVHLLAESREATGERTFFEGVCSLEPSHLISFSETGSHRQRYWDFAVDDPIVLAGADDYAEAFGELLARAVERRCAGQGPIAVSLSGGLDSSSIYCLAGDLLAGSEAGDLLAGSQAAGPGAGSEAGPSRVVGINYTSPQDSPSDESAFIDLLEEDRGTPIRRIPVATGGPLELAEETVDRVESPFLDELAPTMGSFWKAVRSEGARIVLSGHWADQFLFDQAYLVDLARRIRWRKLRAHLTGHSRWFEDAETSARRRRFRRDLVKYALPEPMLHRLRTGRVRRSSTWYSSRIRRLAQSATRMGVMRSPVRPASVHTRALYEQARSSHHVLCLEWDDKITAAEGISLRFPFLDRDLLDFLMRIPGEELNPDGVPKGILRRALRGKVPAPILERTWKADFTWIVNEGVRADLDRIAGLLGPGSRSVARGYTDPEAVGMVMKGAAAGLEEDSAETAWALMNLAGLELWLRRFFG